MLIVSYDFQNDRTRTKFSKFLNKYGRRIQYSVYEIRNSQRVLKNILNEIELKHKKNFKGSDSILILRFCKNCKKDVRRYGYAANEEEELLIW